MKKDDRVTIFLSPGELFWLSTYLGYSSLPFLGGFLKNLSNEQIKELLQSGLETLEMRNLVQDQGKVLQVDGLIQNLIGIIAVPEFALIISTIRRAEPPNQFFIYFKDGRSLMVSQKDRFYNLGLFREASTLERTLTNHLGITTQGSEKASAYLLPGADFIGLLSKVWKDPTTAVDIIQKAGFPPEKSQDLVNSLSVMTNANVVNRIDWEKSTPVKTSQMFILNHLTSLWLMETTGTIPSLIQLIPQNAIYAGNTIRRFIQPTFQMYVENQEEIS
jgi:hypothetical protein